MAQRVSMSGFKVVSGLAALLFLALFVNLFFFPGSLCEGFGIEASPSLFIIARRASALMLGFAVLLLATITAPPSPTRRAVSLAAGVTMAGFALTGSYEILRGALRSSVWGAVGVETAFAIAFVTLWVMERRIVGAPVTPTR
jgi:hypothetical protein